MSNKPQIFLYEIERLISRRSTDKGTEYFIKWKDYSEDQNTWEPLSNLLLDKAYDAIYFFESKCYDEPPGDVLEFIAKYKEKKAEQIEKIIESEDDIKNQMEEDWLSDFGCMPKDSIKRIIQLERNQSNQAIYALVEWNMRSLTGIKPTDSYVKSSKLKKYCLKQYIDYLEGIMYTDK